MPLPFSSPLFAVLSPSSTYSSPSYYTFSLFSFSLAHFFPIVTLTHVSFTLLTVIHYLYYLSLHHFLSPSLFFSLSPPRPLRPSYSCYPSFSIIFLSTSCFFPSSSVFLPSPISQPHPSLLLYSHSPTVTYHLSSSISPSLFSPSPTFPSHPSLHPSPLLFLTLLPPISLSIFLPSLHPFLPPPPSSNTSHYSRGGNDGAREIGQIYKEGGMTLAQEASSCIVYGMPRVAVEHEYIRKIVHLDDMAAAIGNLAAGN